MRSRRSMDKSLSEADWNSNSNTNSLNLDMTLNTSFGKGKTSFAITGGGAEFQLGPQVTSSEQVSIGMQSVAADKLGNSRLDSSATSSLAGPRP